MFWPSLFVHRGAPARQAACMRLGFLPALMVSQECGTKAVCCTAGHRSRALCCTPHAWLAFPSPSAPRCRRRLPARPGRRRGPQRGDRSALDRRRRHLERVSRHARHAGLPLCHGWAPLACVNDAAALLPAGEQQPAGEPPLHRCPIASIPPPRSPLYALLPAGSVPVLLEGGAVFRGVELWCGPALHWPQDFYALVAWAPAGADLLDPAAWRASEAARFDRWARRGGWGMHWAGMPGAVRMQGGAVLACRGLPCEFPLFRPGGA